MILSSIDFVSTIVSAALSADKVMVAAFQSES